MVVLNILNEKIEIFFVISYLYQSHTIDHIYDMHSQHPQIEHLLLEEDTFLHTQHINI